MEGKTIKLKQPFEFEGKVLEEIKLKPLRGKDFMGAVKEMNLIQKERGINDEPSAIETAAFLAAKSAGLPFEAVEAMHVDDFVPLAGRFLPLVASIAAGFAGS